MFIKFFSLEEISLLKLTLGHSITNKNNKDILK